jgi:inhibitor of cysteine peptidase
MKSMLLLALSTAMLFGVTLLQAKDDDTKKEEENAVKTLTEKDNSTTVKIAVDTPFDIALPGNPTTGYGWKVTKIDGDAVVQKGKMEHKVNPHPPGMTGVSGVSTFHFEVKKAAKTTIKLSYARPWEKKTKPIKTFTVTIDSEK